MKGFDFEEERIKQEIAKLGAKRVLLQLPEGLKPEAPKIAKTLEKTGALPIISLDPCYGACDLALCEAEGLGVDLIVHFGHAKMVKHEKVPTIYVEARATAPIEAAVLRAIPLLANYTKIGLATSVQHLQTLDEARDLLTREGKIVVIGDSGQIAYPGQVSGCNYSNAKSIVDEVEAFLFVGGGMFHALGIALSTAKPTVIADPYDNRAFLVNDQAEKILRQRFASIQEAKGAKTFGIVVGLKPGQKHLEAALKLRELAEKHGKTAYLLAGREITPEVLLEFPSIDAYVNTACPRISLEATSKFSKPVLTVGEFMVVLGEVSWESLLKGGLFEKLDLELFLTKVASQPTPKVHLEQYTVSPQLAANMLYIAAYANNDIIGKSVLDLGCGTGRLALGAAFLGAESVVGIDIDPLAIKTARDNAEQADLAGCVEWVNGDIGAISGGFDTVVQNPPFGVQTREADRAFLVKALEVGDVVYSLHNHPEVDERLIRMLKSSQGFLQVEPSPFLERFIAKHGGTVKAVYALPMTIPKMFDFHKKAKHDFVIDLYVLEKAALLSQIFRRSIADC